jgi:hypothetical protein
LKQFFPEFIHWHIASLVISWSVFMRLLSSFGASLLNVLGGSFDSERLILTPLAQYCWLGVAFTSASD